MDAEGRAAPPAWVAANVGDEVAVAVGVSLGTAVCVAVGGDCVGEGWVVSVGVGVSVGVFVAVGKTSVAVGGRADGEGGRGVGVMLGAAQPVRRTITMPARKMVVRMELIFCILTSVYLHFKNLINFTFVKIGSILWKTPQFYTFCLHEQEHFPYFSK